MSLNLPTRNLQLDSRSVEVLSENSFLVILDGKCDLEDG